MENIYQKDLSEEIRVARESQLKFVYYVTGLAVASIAYSISQTEGARLTLNQIPLGISIALFFQATILGFSYIRTINASMQMDIHYFKVENEIEANDELNDDQKYYEKVALYKLRLKSEEEFSASNIKSFKYQRLCFLLAILLFVIWRFLEMYSLS